MRPILEYACTVWGPNTSLNIKKIEAVQRRAARFVLRRYHNTSSVKSMMDKLGWQSLQHRRKNSRLTMLYKILHGEVCIDASKMKPAPSRERRGHSQQLQQIPCRTKYRQQSFFPNTIREWNKLPETSVTAQDLDTFVSRIRSL